MANPLVKRVANSTLGRGLITLLERGDRPRPGHLRILTYHRILDPAAFEQQMAHLAENYAVISMPDLLNACKDGRALPPHSVMITFDDAYRDFDQCAWPIMKRYGLPATIFVPTAFPDNPQRVFWWDRLQHALEHSPREEIVGLPVGRLSLKTQKVRLDSYRRLRDHLKSLPYSEILAWTHQICSMLDAPPPEQDVLGWQALRRLAGEGVTLGAHTRNHLFLNQLSAREVEEEVRGSLDDIEREIGTVLPIFAYPDGRFNEMVVEILERAGIVLAFTTRWGTNDMQRVDRLRLGRINIGPRATHLTLRAKLLQASSPLNRLNGR